MADQPKFAPVDLAIMKPMSREFPIYCLTESDLEQLVSGYNSAHLALFGVAFGAFVTIGITWIAEAFASTSPLSSRAAVMFFAATFLSFCFSLFCGISAWKNFAQSKRVVERIKKPPQGSD